MEDSRLPENVLIIHGIGYVAPYIKDIIYSVRLGSENQSVCVVLGNAFRRAAQDVNVAISHFEHEVDAGRVFLERHKKTRDDQRPFTQGFTLVTDKHMLTERGDRLRVVRHVHERAFALSGPIKVLWKSPDNLVHVVNKPAGVPVVDEEGGFGTVGGLMGGWKCGHRLDVCVSGVLIMCKGGGTQARMIQALSPEGKAKNGTRKFYMARVRGRLVETRNVSALMRWDSHAKRSRMVELDGTPTETLVLEGGRYCARSDTSLVEIEITSGFRHQIRAALAGIGHPIVYDTLYGGGESPSPKGKKLFVDDEAGTLLKSLKDSSVPWCDKCAWQQREARDGGTERGMHKVFHFICLHAVRYIVPLFGIDVTAPNPDWANEELIGRE